MKAPTRRSGDRLGDSEACEVGDLVLAIGNPFGVGQTVTQRHRLGARAHQVGVSDYQFFIQTDAAINPGNSGGALIDMDGQLVGINTAIYSRSGGSIGIGFAIPATMVRVVVDSAKAGADACMRPWLGAELQTVTPRDRRSRSASTGRPARWSPRSSTAGRPRRRGLKTGDVVLHVDGQPVDDPDAFGYRFATKSLGGQTQVDGPAQGQAERR